MRKTVGTYFFKRLRSHWGIWMVKSIQNGIEMSAFVKSIASYEEAVRETYSMNGWNVPSKVVRKY